MHLVSRVRSRDQGCSDKDAAQKKIMIYGVNSIVSVHRTHMLKTRKITDGHKKQMKQAKKYGKKNKKSNRSSEVFIWLVIFLWPRDARSM